MGTRGLAGFYINGQTIAAYNQFDSYPTGLGEDVGREIVELIDEHGIDRVKEMASAMRIVSDAEPPTEEDKERLKPWTDIGVSRQSKDDWYCLLRRAQGGIKDYLKAGYIDNAADFILDSLFCEYAYLVNLDNLTLEIYKGFQKTEPIRGRYKGKRERGGEYWACELFRVVTLSDVANIDWQEVEDSMYPDEEEE